MLQNFWICVNGIVPIFLLVGIGVLLRRLHIADEDFGAKATRLVFRLVLPIAIFQDIVTAPVGMDFDGKILFFGILSVIIIFFLGIVLARLVTKDNKKRAAFAQGAFRANYAILGLPLTKALFGEAAITNGTVLLAVGVVLLNILAVTCLEIFLNQKGNFKSTLLGILKNPIIFGAAMGILVKLSGFSLPTVLDNTLSYVGDMCVPLSLIAVGISMRTDAIRESVSLAFWASCIKTVFTPLLFLAPALWAGIRGENLGTLFVFWASPSAIAGYAMIRSMGGDHHMYSNIIFLSTVLSFFSIFFGVFILKNVGLI